MSLAQAVLEIAEEMERAADLVSANQILGVYARQLRRIVTVADLGIPNGNVDSSGRWHSNKYDEKVTSILKSEQISERMVELVGGESDGDLLPVSGAIPTGSKTVIGGQVYQMNSDGKLYYSQEDTNKMKATKVAEKPSK